VISEVAEKDCRPSAVTGTDHFLLAIAVVRLIRGGFSPVDRNSNAEPGALLPLTPDMISGSAGAE
jgi:hypothetical protein